MKPKEEQPRSPIQLRILLAEDNEVNRMVARTMLDRLGHDVDEVRHGKEALEALQSQQYDLVFMDVQMPVMNGLEATKAIRLFEGERRHTPLIAMTAYAMKGDRERCLAVGMDDYVSKPVRETELREVIERWTPSTAKGTASGGAVVRVEATQPIDLDKLWEIAMDDPVLMAELIKLFLADAPQRLGRLRQAIDEKQQRTVVEIAHGLRGASRSLAAEKLGELFHAVEEISGAGKLDEAGSKVAEAEAEFARLQEFLSGVDLQKAPTHRTADYT